MDRFEGDFTAQAPLPEAAIEAALGVLRSPRLHRYAPGDDPVAALERRYAAWQGRAFCLAVASGGQAMQIALRAAGVGPGDAVLTNAFTLAPVPGAIAGVGARPVLVEIDADLRLDIGDLVAKAGTSGARVLLLSQMRGHLGDMAAISATCDRLGLTLIEDCAHTMGATRDGLRAGNFGRAGCFSTQSYKHMDSGEGGLIVSDDADLMARATVLSGSYMHYARHGAGPSEAAFAEARRDMPNLSARMDALRAAILLPQIDGLEARCDAWTARHDRIARALADVPGLVMPAPDPAERRVGSSLQFRLPERDAARCAAFVVACAARGVTVKWFGRSTPEGFTSAHASWGCVAPQDLPQTDAVLATLFDMRVSLTFGLVDCDRIGSILADEAARA